MHMHTILMQPWIPTEATIETAVALQFQPRHKIRLH